MQINGKEYRLVPVEPTEEMLDAICNAPLLFSSPDVSVLREHWALLLAATPRPPEATEVAQDKPICSWCRGSGGFGFPVTRCPGCGGTGTSEDADANAHAATQRQQAAQDALDAARWRAFRARDALPDLDYTAFQDQFREDADAVIDAATSAGGENG